MKRLFIYIVFFYSIASLCAQNLTAHRNEVKDAYSFWFRTPEVGSGDSIARPLVVFLHGRSLCGTDLNRVRRYGPLDAISRGLRLDAYVLAPQNPGGAWRPQRVMRLVEWAVKHYNVDTNRIYVVGMSLGGYGTIDFVGTYPNKIAAAMALCGGGTIKELCGLAQVPL